MTTKEINIVLPNYIDEKTCGTIFSTLGTCYKNNLRLTRGTVTYLRKNCLKFGRYKNQFKTLFEFIMKSPRPSRGLNFLNFVGLLRVFMPEVYDLRSVDDVAEGTHKDIYEHSLTVLDTVARQSRNLNLRLAALLHDIGKPSVKELGSRGWKFPNHHYVGARMVHKILNRYGYDEATKSYISTLVLMHMQPINLMNDGVTDSACRRFYTKLGKNMEDLKTLCIADITTKEESVKQLNMSNIANIFSRIDAIKTSDEISSIKLPFDGHYMMSIYELPDLGVISDIKDKIRLDIYMHKISNNESECKDRLSYYANEYKLKTKV